MLTCPYNLKKDTVEGLVSELTKAINLNSDDCNIVTSKLYDSIQNFKSNKREKFDKFCKQYSDFINTINIINNSEYSKSLNFYYEKFVILEQSNSDLFNKLKSYKNQKNSLLKFNSCK